MLQISLTYACNFRCSYCSLELPTGTRPKAKTMGLQQWKEIISNFPVKVREVFISGGEPTLIDYLPELCNWLLDNGYHVTVFTNLREVHCFDLVKQSYKFQIVATFHQEQDDADSFDMAYQYIKSRHNVKVGELGTRPKMLSYSTMEKLFRDCSGLMDSEFRYSPDGRLYTSCYEHYLDKSL